MATAKYPLHAHAYLAATPHRTAANKSFIKNALRTLQLAFAFSDLGDGDGDGGKFVN